ncbi:MAG TPA: NF038122 family metalloprotease [Verrucomicrobiota bacterium]|nr:NF038122 family metalloprotease [Verrucomicrobiota bacterium]HNU52842.1 NF038122 family metalloprotease [Verrucomicrobiota bacterium]
MKATITLPRTALCVTAAATLAVAGTQAADLFFLHSTEDHGMLTPITRPPSELGSFAININPLSGLQGNPDALAAFYRAANQWEAFISDPITVTIDGDMANLGNPNIIGSTSLTTYWTANYSVLRNQMITDEAAEGSVHPIVASLPASPVFYAPTGFTIGGYSASRATFNALGYTVPSEKDATITFNSTFTFDYDNSDGVTPGTMDFETVAAHEIGHALGFISDVDRADYLVSQKQTGPLYPTPLDLYRFRDDADDNPSTASDFASYPRSLLPGDPAHTDQIFITSSPAEIAMATGAYTGDGRQASHWKDNLGIGIMDPTLNYGEVVAISTADLLALDLIGWNAVPEPRDYALVFGCASLGIAWMTRRLRKRAIP